MTTPEEPPIAALAARSVVAGLLMGLGNLVPGIAGGTMLVAMGVYPRFIAAISEVTTFRFRLRSILHLVSLGAGVLLTIVLLVGPVRMLVAEHRWLMYSIFLGLSLGGIPPVWRMAKGGSPAFAFGIGAGFLAMVAIVFARPGGDGTVAWWELVYGGTVAAGAAILPGVDGSYLLLVLGQYETVLGALHQATRLELAAALRVLGPFLVGSLVALATLSNLLRWLFRRHEQPTLGVLLGFLAGSVIGIYPFQQAAAEGAPRTHYVPAAWQLAAALALVAAGFAVTRLVDRLGRTA